MRKWLHTIGVSLVLVLMMVFVSGMAVPAKAASVVASGTWDAYWSNVVKFTWTLDNDGILYISGEDRLSWTDDSAPWSDYFDRKR